MLLTSVSSVKPSVDHQFGPGLSTLALCCLGEAWIRALANLLPVWMETSRLHLCPVKPRSGCWHIIHRLVPCHTAENSPKCSKSFA